MGINTHKYIGFTAFQANNNFRPLYFNSFKYSSAAAWYKADRWTKMNDLLTTAAVCPKPKFRPILR